MIAIRVQAERRVAAPAERVYGYIADYRAHHHRFLPTNFSDYQVEAGGVGEGTIVRFRVTSGGRTRAFRTYTSEPAPGRVLTETDQLSPLATTWTVTPDGDQCRVHVETVWQDAGGLMGLIERLFGPAMMRRLYADELTRLDQYARSQGAEVGANGTG